MVNKRKLIVIVVTMIFILGLSIDLYAPSFPAIQTALGTIKQRVQLTITSYFCGYFIGLLFLGPISDSLGRKRPLIFMMSFYMLMSVLCVFAPSIEILLLFRALQGIGASIVGISFRSILSDVFEGRDLAKAMSYTSMSYRVGPIIAPVIGGYLQVYFGWQSNFIFLAAYALLLLLLIIFSLPETHLEKIPFEAKTLLKRYWAILSNKTFTGASVCVGIQYGMLLVFNMVAPFFLQDVLGYSPITYGHIAFIVGVFAFCGILVNRLLLQRYSHLSLTAIGIYGIVFFSGVYAFVSWLSPTSLWAFITPIFLILLSTGLMVSNMLSHAMSLIPRGKGTASALQSITLILTSIILTYFGSFLKTQSSLPFSLFYLALALVMLGIYRFLFVEKSPN